MGSGLSLPDKVVKIDVDDNEEIMQQQGLRGVPAFLLFNNGELVDRMTGAQTKAQFQEFLNKNI